MKIASHTLGFNIDRFLPDVIDNAGPHVDKIFVALPRRPWSYNPNAREAETNPTTVESFRGSKYFNKIEFVTGDWETEEAMRNACLHRAVEQGFDWFLTQDADEFYTDTAWSQIHAALAAMPGDVDIVVTTWFNFWKSAQFVIQYDNGSIKDKNANFAMRCSPTARFIRGRVAAGKEPVILDTPCFHFGWVLSDEEMQIKIRTWKHTTEFNPSVWYALKWHGWTERSRYLNPTNPTFWTRAVRTPFELPDFAQRYATSLDVQRIPPLREQLSERWYNSKHVAKASLRYWKRSTVGRNQSLR